MSHAFVWFHNNSQKPEAAVGFYERLLGWQRADSPPGLTMLAGPQGPFAGVGKATGQAGWVPFVEVSDVDRVAEEAVGLGAKVVAPKTRGPAGEFVIVSDTGGAVVALWQKA